MPDTDQTPAAAAAKQNVDEIKDVEATQKRPLGGDNGEPAEPVKAPMPPPHPF